MKQQNLVKTDQALSNRMDILLSERDVLIQLSMLKETLLELNPSKLKLNEIVKALHKYFNNFALAHVLRYIAGNGIRITFKRVCHVLNKQRLFARFPTIWDSSSEQYIENDFKKYWETLEKVKQYQLEYFTDEKSNDLLSNPLHLIREKAVNRQLRGLLLGCHESYYPPEINFYKTGQFESLEVMDIAVELLEIQRKNAINHGMDPIIYTVSDLNHVALKPNYYDFIWSVGTIHHIENLEALFDQINGALNKNGIFVYRDYVGPSRLQFSNRQLSIVNGLLKLIPEKYRRDMYGGTINQVYKTPINHLIKTDPSEAIRSVDIVPILTEKLKIEKLEFTGGTILQPLLGNIASNFEKDDYGESIIEMLINFEKHLLHDGEITSDYIFCVARKKY